MYSFSKLNTYEFCPKLYEFVYIDKIKQEANEDMKFGKLFHKFAENFYKRIDVEKITYHEFDELLVSKEELNNFIKYEKKRYQKLLMNGKLNLYKPLLLEEKLIGEISGSEFIGYVDRVERLVNGEILVMDYKAKEPTSDMAIKSLKRQLSIYGDLLEQRNAIKVDSIGSYFYRNDTDVSYPFSGQIKNAMRKWVRNTVEKIESDEVFEMKQRKSCDDCSFKSKCFEGGE